MKEIYNIDGLPGITMQGKQGATGERGCTTLVSINKCTTGEITNGTKVIGIIDGNNDGVVYFSAEGSPISLPSDIYESITGIYPEENDPSLFVIMDGQNPVVGDHVISTGVSDTKLYKIVNVITTDGIDTEDSSADAELLNKVSMYQAYFDTYTSLDSDTVPNKLTGVILQLIDEWAYTPSDVNMDLDLTVSVSTSHINMRGWDGNYVHPNSMTPETTLTSKPVTFTYTGNQAESEREAAVRNEVLNNFTHGVKNGNDYVKEYQLNVKLLNAFTEAPVGGITVELFATQGDITKLSDIPVEPIGSAVSGEDGTCNFTLAEDVMYNDQLVLEDEYRDSNWHWHNTNIYKMLYVRTTSTDTSEYDMNKRYKRHIAPVVYIRERTMALYMLSSEDINQYQDQLSVSYQGDVGNSSIPQETKIWVDVSKFLIESSMSSENKEKIQVVAEFTLKNGNFFITDSAFCEKRMEPKVIPLKEDGSDSVNPYNGSPIWSLDSSMGYYRIGDSPTRYPFYRVFAKDAQPDVYYTTNTGDKIQGKDAVRTYGEMGNVYLVEFYQRTYEDGRYGYVMNYPIPNTASHEGFNFDCERPRMFSLIIKDFGEGNDGTQYTSNCILPKGMVEDYMINIYLYVNNGAAGISRVFVGQANGSDTTDEE